MKRPVEMGAFKRGMTAFFFGQKYVYLQHPQLLKYAWIPMLLGVWVFVGGGVCYFLNIDTVISWLWPKPDGWLWQSLWYMFLGTTIFLSVATILLLSLLAFMILCGPFNDYLSEQVEAIEGTFIPQPFDLGFALKDGWHSIVIETFKAGQRLLWIGPLFILSLVVPVVGQLLYVGIGGYKMSLWLGMEYVDWALARRGYSAAERIAFAKQNRWPILGFGLIMTLGSLFPLGAVVLWPGAVAGGTLLCTGLTPQDRRKRCSNQNSNLAEIEKAE